jgi:hypothetical protein
MGFAPLNPSYALRTFADPLRIEGLRDALGHGGYALRAAPAARMSEATSGFSSPHKRHRVSLSLMRSTGRCTA